MIIQYNTVPFQSFVKQRSLPDNTNVTRVPETGEPPEFKVLFNHWETPKVPGNKTYSQGKIGQFSIRDQSSVSIVAAAELTILIHFL